MLLLGWGCHKLFCGDATSEQTRVAVFHQVGGGGKVERCQGGRVAGGKDMVVAGGKLTRQQGDKVAGAVVIWLATD